MPDRPRVLISDNLATACTGVLEEHGCAADYRAGIDLDGVRVNFAMPPLAGAILARVDGMRSVGEIHQDVARTESPGIDLRIFARQFQEVFRVANGLGRMFLRARRGG